MSITRVDRGFDLDIQFNQGELLPGNKIGNAVNWNLVFRNAIDIYYPSPTNWNSCTDKDGEFDPVKFYFNSYSRHLGLEKRTEYINQLKQIIDNFENYGDKSIVGVCSYVEDILVRILLIVDIYESDKDSLDFVNGLREIVDNISQGSWLAGEDKSLNIILSQVDKNLKLFHEWDANMWLNFPNKLYQEYVIDNGKLIQYQNQDGSLKVNSILEDLNAHWSWNEEVMSIALLTSTCSKSELDRLRSGVSEALHNKFKRLDAYKIFIILERVLPFIYEGFEINFDFPEIFNPKYLSKISISNLDIDKFTSKVRTVGANEGWSLEVQERLIEQFKQYGSSESGKIGFGQGSEQLWYWTRVTGYLNEKNIHHYLKGSEYGDDKRPVPRMLRQPTTETKLIELLK